MEVCIVGSFVFSGILFNTRTSLGGGVRTPWRSANGRRRPFCGVQRPQRRLLGTTWSPRSLGKLALRLVREVLAGSTVGGSHFRTLSRRQ